MGNERKTGENPSRNSPQQNAWWLENRRGLIAYIAVAGAITLPIVGLGITFSQPTPNVSESPSQSPAIELKTQTPMPSVAAAMVLSGS